MGLLDRLRGKNPILQPANTPPDWATTNAWLTWPAPLNLIREGFYQDNVFSITGPPCKDGYLIPVAVTLTREPGNDHDRNAVTAHIEGTMVGYLHRDLVHDLSPALDRHGVRSFIVCGVIRGGRKRGRSLVAVHVWMDRTLGPAPELLGIPRDEFWITWPPQQPELDAAISTLASDRARAR